MKLKLHIFAILLLQVTSTALAEEVDTINPDRPGIADGSMVVGAGRFQIETGIQQETRQSGASSDRRLFVPTLLRMGVGDNWEARIESNLYGWKSVTASVGGDMQSEGSQPLSLGVKYQCQTTDDSHRPSLGAILRLFPPSGSGDFRTQNTTGDFRLAADWDFAPGWSLNPNVGVGVYEDDQGELLTAQLFALTLSFSPTQTLNFFADTGMQSPESKNGITAITNDAGVAYLLDADVQLDFSLGSGASGTTPPDSFFSFGISKRY